MEGKEISKIHFYKILRPIFSDLIVNFGNLTVI